MSANRVNVGTCCIVNAHVFHMSVADGDERRTLFLKRKGSHGQGTWSLPGGWVEAGEGGPLATVIRELQEEVGLKVEEGEVLFVGWTHDDHPEQLESLTMFFRVFIDDWEDAIPLEPEKASDLGWFLPHRLPDPLFLPVENFLAKGGRLWT